MAQKKDKAAILASTLRFLTAGGLTLAIAVAQEVAKPDRNWALIATMAGGLLIGIGGGAYGRINAQGPISSVPPK
ncbi:MAG: hypothetical protein QM773_17005 [Hyphomonadaceae bacterium]